MPEMVPFKFRQGDNIEVVALVFQCASEIKHTPCQQGWYWRQLPAPSPEIGGLARVSAVLRSNFPSSKTKLASTEIYVDHDFSASSLYGQRQACVSFSKLPDMSERKTAP